MGNDETKDTHKEEYITFQFIQESLDIKDPILFKKYLQEVFNDLSNKSSSNNIKYLPRTTFFDYIKLPIFISEKLYSSFSYRNKEGLILEEFVDGFFRLYIGTFEDTAKIIFNILDYNKDGLINGDDVKLLLSYLPLNNDLSLNKKEELVSKIFGDQMKSLEEIDEIVKETFNRYDDEINFQQFIETIKNNNSEVYLQILCFLYEKMPFTSKNIDCLRKKYYSFDEDEYRGISNSFKNYKKQNSIKIKTPKKDSMLSPAGSFLNKRLRIRSFSLNEEAKEIIKNELNGLNSSKRKNTYSNEILSNSSSKQESTSYSNSIKENKNELIDLNLEDKNDEEKEEKENNEIEEKKEKEENKEKEEKNLNNDFYYNKNINLVRFNNENIINKKNEKNNKEENKEKLNNIDNLCKSSRKNYVSPTKYLQEKICLNIITLNKASSHSENQLLTINEENEGEKINSQQNKNDNEEQNQNICYGNWIYKITDEKKIKKFYLVLINKDIFYYNSEDKKEFLGMHNLSGCFIQENGEKNSIRLDGKEYYKFEIYFNNKSKIRQYYSLEYETVKQFVQNIKKSIGYIKFSDIYEIKQVIGKGKFGVVNLGIHKKSGKQVAIKIMNKAIIKTTEDKELVRIEIDVLKLCHHPNIVRLLDHLENNEYIFIVMEYIE